MQPKRYEEMNVFSRGAALSVVLLFAAAQHTARAEVVMDVLDSPARHEARPERSQIMALSRAGERLVAVGERGLVLLSDDLGRSWRQAASVPVSVTLTDVVFVTAEKGWAVGHSGVILHSSDAGENWTRQIDGRLAASLVLDAAKARVAAGEPDAERELRSAEYLVQDGPDKPFLGVAFRDERHGYAVGAYGLALATADGGSSWYALQGRMANPGGKHLYQVQVDGERLLIAGEQGALFRSQDGGRSFHELITPYEGTFFGALDLGRGVLLAYGLRGNVWRSEDDGANWHQVDVLEPVSLAAATRLANGAFLLGNESGRLLQGQRSAAQLAELPVTAEGVLTGIAENADGSLVLAGSHGLQRIENLSERGRP